MSNTVESIRNKASMAADLAEEWMLEHISKENIYASYVSDPVSYYKWPLTLFSRGKKDEASKLLGWINEQCLTEDGDYRSNRNGFHKEFHHYSTLWLVLAAIKLDNKLLVEKLLSFLLKYHNSQTGGLATFPAESGFITEDLVSTAFLGMVACDLKDKSLAQKILRFFETTISLQNEEGKFWLRINPSGSLVKAIQPESDPKTYYITIGKENECYYFLGAACYFIARYIETFDDKPLYLADQFAKLLERAGTKALSTIWAAKVAPGCVALFAATADERFLNLAYPVIHTVLKSQTPIGCWMKDEKPWITVSAEQCFWLTDIEKRLRTKDLKSLD